MAQVEISGDTLEFLKGFMTRINTQDNRATRLPIYYTIQEDVVEHNRDTETGDTVYAHTDEFDEIGGIEDLRKYLIERYTEDGEKDLVEKVKKADEFDLEEIANDDKYLNIEKVGRHESTRHREFFLTEEACHKHIEENKHHYTNPKSFVHHAWRHPELEKLMEALGEITGLGFNRK